MLRLVAHRFALYKFFNSLFLGLSVGAVFTLYTPLSPKLFSMGGILLAIGMLIVARLYPYLINIKSFFLISVTVEVILLLAILFFLFMGHGYESALIVYIAYQLTFVFGNYLVRSETIFLTDKTLLMKLDTAKQLGYLLGMALSYLFYESMQYMGIEEAKKQVFYLHFVLVFVELLTIAQLLRSVERINPHQDRSQTRSSR